MLLIMQNKWFLRSGAARSRMHRNVVNSRTANIFKRILQTQNSTGNGKRFAKMRRRKMCGSCVYHSGINHAARSSELYDLFRPGSGAARYGNLLFQRQGKVPTGGIIDRSGFVPAKAHRRFCNGAQQNEQANLPSPCPSPHGRGDARICAAVGTRAHLSLGWAWRELPRGTRFL